MAKIIYLISPNKIYKSFYSDLNLVLKSKLVKYFQLRLKKKKNSSLKELLIKIKRITQKNKVKLIINDNAKLVKKTNIDGCHLGQKDLDIKLARKLIKNKWNLIQSSESNPLKLAKKAELNKADYIAIGSFYKSKLKPNAIKTSLKTLRKIRKVTSLTIVGIGGINNKNFKKILKFGANYIAISSFIWNNPKLKPYEAIKKFKLWKLQPMK